MNCMHYPQADVNIASAVHALVAVLQRHVQPGHESEGQGQSANLAPNPQVETARAVQSDSYQNRNRGPTVHQEMARFN